MAKRIEDLLQELGRRAVEAAPPGLSETIKHQIPDRIMTPRWGKDTVNIIVHLKVSRVAAAAAIVISLVVFGGVFGRGAGWYQDIRGMVNEFVSREDSSRSSLANVYEDMASNGVEVVYYGQYANSQDPTQILMHWKLPEGDYRVVFSNGRVVRVSAEELIRLQSNMIRDWR